MTPVVNTVMLVGASESAVKGVSAGGANHIPAMRRALTSTVDMHADDMRPSAARLTDVLRSRWPGCPAGTGVVGI